MLLVWVETPVTSVSVFQRSPLDTDKITTDALREAEQREKLRAMAMNQNFKNLDTFTGTRGKLGLLHYLSYLSEMVAMTTLPAWRTRTEFDVDLISTCALPEDSRG